MPVTYSNADTFVRGCPVSDPSEINLELSRKNINFPEVPAGESSDGEQLVLKNTGWVPVNITDITIHGDFVLNSVIPSTIYPGQLATLDVRMLPKGGGVVSGVLLIEVDGLAGSIPVFLSGSGEETYLEEKLFNELEGATIPEGQTVIRTIGFETQGVGAATYIKDASVDAAYVADHPLSSAIDDAGNGWRIDLTQGVSLDQLGAIKDDSDIEACAANEAAWVEALTISDVIIVPIGRFHIQNPLVLKNNLVVRGHGGDVSQFSNITPDTGIFIHVGALDVASVFTVFAKNVTFKELGFVSNTPQAAHGITIYNVKGFTADSLRFINYGGIVINHAASFYSLYSTSNGASGNPGVGIDPAVVAGFSAAENAEDLNSDILVSNCFIETGRHNGQLVRLNWAQRATISGNICRGAKISWWGGGAPINEGGEPWMRRRVRNVTITGNYFDEVNGAIYGNNGDGIVITGNTAKNISDTAYDMEGCFNCTITGNHIQDAGNFTLSIFYAAKNIVFSGNTCIQTIEGRNVGLDQNFYGYSSNTSPDSISGASGKIRITKAGHRYLTGQKIAIRSAGGSLSEMVDTIWKLTKIDANTVELDGSEAYAALAASGSIGSYSYRNARSFFAANTAGFATNDEAHTVLVTGNIFWYDVPEDTGNLSGDQDIRSYTVQGNYLRNVRINLTGNSAKHIISDNTLDFTNPLFPGEFMIEAMGTIKNNTIINLANQPEGCAAIVLHESAFNGTWGAVVGNSVTNPYAYNLTHEIAVYTREADGHTADSHILISNNRLRDGKFADLSTLKGVSRVRYENNTRMRSGRISEACPSNDSEKNDLGGIVRGTTLYSNAPAAGAYSASIAINDGWATEQAWASGQTVAVNDIRYNGTEVYVARTGGNCGATAPTHTSGAASDGTIDWYWIGKKTIWKGIGMIEA